VFTVVGGLLAAVCWSAAGLASSVAGRRVGPMLALAWVNLAAMLVVLVVALALDGIPHDIPGVEVAWVSIYGLALVGALAAAFKSMTLGPVGLVAPVISTEGAFATLFGLALGEAVGGTTGLALGLIVIGIVLSAIDTDPLGGGSMLAATAVNRKALSIGLASAVLFAISLVAASRCDTLGVPWTIAVGRITGLLLITIPVLARERLRRPVGAYRMLTLNGAGDLLGFTLFLMATEDGVAVPAVLASQYATITALFGYFVFKERLKTWQWAGVILTIAGTALVGATTA
jgi:drug/metabolite transporter (DMT)-like permease